MTSKPARPFTMPLPAARRALQAGAALLLASAVVAAPASADDAKALDAVGQPVGVATGPDGTLYVSDETYPGGVSVYKPGETAPSRTITTGNGPSSLAVTPDGTLYVAQSEGAQSEIGLVAPGADRVSLVMKVSFGRHRLVVGPDGSLYVVNPEENSLSVVKPGDAWVHRTIQAGRYPVEVAWPRTGRCMPPTSSRAP